MTAVVPGRARRSKVAKISVSLPRDFVERIDRPQEELGETRSELVRAAVEQLLRNEQERADVAQWIRSYKEQPQTEEELGFAEAALAAWADLPWDSVDPWEDGASVPQRQ